MWLVKGGQMTKQNMLIGTRHRYAFDGIKKAIVAHLFELSFDCFRHNTHILDIHIIKTFSKLSTRCTSKWNIACGDLKMAG